MIPEEYQLLIAKVDEKFAQIAMKHRMSMSCSQRCSSCCTSGFTVSKVEQENIRQHLLANPIITTNPREDFCSFLDGNESCVIYNVRPIICRSHGVPSYLHEDGQEIKQVCPLNFTNNSLDNLESSDFINLDHLNTLLALINQKYYPEHHRERFLLVPSVIMGRNATFKIDG